MQPGDNLSGWAAVGYGANGGYQRDAANRQQIQQSALAYQKAQTGLTNSETNVYNQKLADLQAKQNQLEYQQHLAQNQVAASSLDNATSALINHHNWEQFNNTIKSNPVLADSMQRNYGVSSIRPIDWNNPQDVSQVEKIIPKQELAKLSPVAKQEIGKSYYMTSAGHLASLGEFAQDTGYFNRATSSDLNSYTAAQQKLQEALKPPTTASIAANSEQEWLKNNPGKTANDWTALNSVAKNAGKGPTRADRMTQLRTINASAMYGKPYADLTPEQKQHIDKTASVIMDAGTSQGKENMDVNDINTAVKVGNGLMDNNTQYTSLTKTQRDNLDTQFKLTPVYSQYKKPLETFNSQYANLKFAEGFNKTLQEAVKNGTYKTGFLQNLKTTINKYTPKELRNMVGLPDKDLATKLDLQGTLGMMVAERLKAMSGTAASDDEFKRTLDYVIGNNNYNQQTQGIILSNNVRNQAKMLENNGELLVRAGFVGNTYDRVKNIQNFLNGGTPTQPNSQVPQTQPTETINNVTPGSQAQGTPNSQVAQTQTEQPIIIVNHKTGEKLQAINGKWEQIK